MLPSWRDEIRIALSPDHLAVVRVSRRWRPKVVARRVVQWQAGASSEWQYGVEALQQVLQDPAWRRADACVGPSNHFVRYAPAPGVSTSRRTKRSVRGSPIISSSSMANRQCPSIIDGLTTGRTVRCVASAVESDLISRIRAAFESTSLRLRSVQPYLMAAFNRCRKHVMACRLCRRRRTCLHRDDCRRSVAKFELQRRGSGLAKRGITAARASAVAGGG